MANHIAVKWPEAWNSRVAVEAVTCSPWLMASAEYGSRSPASSHAAAIQPAALASNRAFPGPRSATVSTARGHMSLFTELEDAQATDREGRAGDRRRGRNEPHVEPFEPVARQMKGIDDLRDLEDLVDAAAGGGTIRIARGRDPEQGDGSCQPVGICCRVGVWRKVDVDVIIAASLVPRMPSSLRKTRAGSALDLASVDATRARLLRRDCVAEGSSRTAAPVAPATRTSPSLAPINSGVFSGTHRSVLAFPGAANGDSRAKPGRTTHGAPLDDRRRFVFIAVVERRCGRVQDVARPEGPLALVTCGKHELPVRRSIEPGCEVWVLMLLLRVAQPGAPETIDVGVVQPEDRVECRSHRHRHQPEIAPVVGIPTRRDATDRAVNDVVRQRFEAAVRGVRLGPVVEMVSGPPNPGGMSLSPPVNTSS